MERTSPALLLAFATALVLASAAAWAAPAGGAEARVVERVVAVIRSPAAQQPRVITLTKVEEETRVALIARGGTLAASAPLDAKALRAGLDWVIDQTLLADEAARLQIPEIDPADVAAEVQRFKARFARPAEYAAFLARLDLPEDELAAMLRRALRVKRYVESRVGRPGELPEERVAGEVKALVADLRNRSEVRVLHDFGDRG
jgi:hypothetical protein